MTPTTKKMGPLQETARLLEMGSPGEGKTVTGGHFMSEDSPPEDAIQAGNALALVKLKGKSNQIRNASVCDTQMELSMDTKTCGDSLGREKRRGQVRALRASPVLTSGERVKGQQRRKICNVLFLRCVILWRRRYKANLGVSKC